MNRSVQQAAELQTAVRSATDRAVAGRAHLYGVALHNISDSSISDISTDESKTPHLRDRPRAMPGRRSDLQAAERRPAVRSPWPTSQAVAGLAHLYSVSTYQ